jgi:hypothetical protein
MYNLPTELSRQRIMAEYRSTNYSVVNPRTLEIVSEFLDRLDAGRKIDVHRPSYTKRSIIRDLKKECNLVYHQMIKSLA